MAAAAAYWNIGNLTIVWVRGQWIPIFVEDTVYSIQFGIYRPPSNTPPAWNSAEPQLTLSIDENVAGGTEVGVVDATDADAGDVLTYGVSGADIIDLQAFHELFDFDSGTGRITVKALSTLDFETKPSYEILVEAHDGKDSVGGASSLIDTRLPVSIALRNVDEPGSGTFSTMSPLVDEELTAEFSDPDGIASSPELQWSSSGASTGPFTPIATATEAAYTPVRADVGKILKLTVSYDDVQGADKQLEVISERPVGGPAITGGSGPLFAQRAEICTVGENAAGATVVGTFASSNPHSSTLTYTVTGVDIAAFNEHFDFDGANGRVTVKQDAMLNYERRPAYILTLSVTDNIDSLGDPSPAADDEQSLTINVSDVDESGSVLLAAQLPVESNTFTATFTDPDSDVVVEGWQWSSASTHGGSYSEITGARGTSYTPTEDDLGKYLKATADYTDIHGTGKRAEGKTPHQVGTQIATGSIDGVGFAARNAVRSISEAAAAGKLVVIIRANNPDNATLQYSVAGQDINEFNRDFTLDTSGGRITVKPGAALDYETLNSYSIMMSVTDNLDGSGNFSSAADDTIAVAINLINEDEAGTLTLSSSELRVRDPLAAVLSDEDRGFGNQAWQWYSSDASEGPFTEIAGATAVTYIPTDDVEDKYLRPKFAQSAYTFTVSEEPASGDLIGTVAASDFENNPLTYSVSGTDLTEFNRDFTLDTSSGRITVSQAAQVDKETKASYSIMISVSDGKDSDGVASAGIDATARLTIWVGQEPRPTVGGDANLQGGSGSSGPSQPGQPRQPTPSEADFEWNVLRDFGPLHCDNDVPVGIWSDGETLWVLDNSRRLTSSVFAYDLASGERRTEREFEHDCLNQLSRGVWSDGETLWVADADEDRLFAYNLESDERAADSDFILAARNRDPRGIWSDGETMYVLDNAKRSLFAYDLNSADLVSEYALDGFNAAPRGIWSDGATIWVSDDIANRLFAYRLEQGALTRLS